MNATAPGAVVPLVPVTRIDVGEEEAAAVARVLASGWLTSGPEVEAFEREFASAVGAVDACAVSSCTAALHLALVVAGVRPGDEVITVSHSFIATADAVRIAGATPVFIDVDPTTGNMDPSLVDGAVSDRTRAVLCVHQLGVPCDLAAIASVAKARGLVLIEDAACAIGSEILWQGRWERIGRPHGDVACFSFHPRKLLTTGDGGMLVARDPGWAARARRLRSHGRTVSPYLRHREARAETGEYAEPGFNYRMTDLQAAIGRAQLARLAEIIRARRRLASRYNDALADTAGLRLPVDPSFARSNAQSYAVTLDADVDVERVRSALRDAGIATLPGVMCAHRERACRAGSWRAGSASLRHGEDLQTRSIILPLFAQMTDAEQVSVIVALRTASAQSSRRGR